MNPQQFVWWLSGYMECIGEDKRLPNSDEWIKIKEILQSVTCWEIEQGSDSK